MGGGMFMGLCAKLAGIRTFDEAMELAAKGSQAHCDLTMSDIVGDELGAQVPEINGARSLALFGAFALNDSSREASVEPADLARSLVYMMSFHLSELTYLFYQIEVHCDKYF